MAQEFINETKFITDKQGQLRNLSLQLIKKIMKEYNMSDIVISTIDEKLVHAVFMLDCARTEAVRSIFLKDDRLVFETYNGLLGEDQVIGGLEIIMQRIKTRLLN